MLKFLKSIFERITSQEVVSVNSHLESYRQKMLELLAPTVRELGQNGYTLSDN